MNLDTEGIEANSVIRERIARAKNIINNELEEYSRRARSLRDISRAKASAERRHERKLSDKTAACLHAVSREYDECYRNTSECHARLARYISIVEKDWNKLILQVGILDSKSAPKEQNEFHKFKRHIDLKKGASDDMLRQEGIELGNYTRATAVPVSHDGEDKPEPVCAKPVSSADLPDPVPASTSETPRLIEETKEAAVSPAEPQSREVSIAPVTIDISSYVERAVHQTVDKMASLVDRRIEEYFRNYQPTPSDELVAKIVDAVIAAIPRSVVTAPEAAEAPKAETAPVAAEAPKTETAPEAAEAPKAETAPEAAEAPKAETAPVSSEKCESAPASEITVPVGAPELHIGEISAECEALAAKIADDERYLLDKLIAMLEEIKTLGNDMAGVAAAFTEIESRFREIAEQQRVTNDMQRHTLREQQGIQVSQRVINKDQLTVAEEQLGITDAQKKAIDEQARVAAAQTAVAESQGAVAGTQTSIEEAMRAVIAEQKRIIAAQQQIVNENARLAEAHRRIADQQSEISEEQKGLLASQRGVLKDQKSAAERQRETAEAQRTVMEEVREIMKSRPKTKA